MAGRKPLPTELKLIKGTARKCRVSKLEPRPSPSTPSAPEHVKGYAREEWGRVTDELARLGLLTLVDRAALAAYCVAYSRWRQAEELLESEGLVTSTTNGNVIQNPLVGVANKAMELMHKFLTEFGMTPSARSRVRPVEEKPASEWDEVMG